jgi:AcrR family transcriptional regulator
MATSARLPLTRERILETALELADRAGVEAVTMRKLGDELGFEAMSLYRYVGNKHDLLGGMLDLVLDEWRMPDSEGDWAAAIRMSARSVHGGLRRHPWAAQLLMTGMHIRPKRLEYMDRLLATLRDAGFDADTTYHVYHLLDGHIFGFSLWEIAYASTGDDTEERVAESMQRVPWHEYPRLTEHRDQHMTEGPHREVSAFDVGLDLILDGLATDAISRDRTHGH